MWNPFFLSLKGYKNEMSFINDFAVYIRLSMFKSQAGHPNTHTHTRRLNQADRQKSGKKYRDINRQYVRREKEECKFQSRTQILFIRYKLFNNFIWEVNNVLKRLRNGTDAETMLQGTKEITEFNKMTGTDNLQ